MSTESSLTEVSSESSSDADYVEKRKRRGTTRKVQVKTPIRTKARRQFSVLFESLLADSENAGGRAVATLTEKSADNALIEVLDILLQSGGASTESLLGDDVLTTPIAELAEGITATIQSYDCPLTSYITLQKGGTVKLTPVTRIALPDLFPHGIDPFHTIISGQPDLTDLTAIGALNRMEVIRQPKTLVLPIFKRVWVAIGREFESVFRRHSKRVLELLALLTDSECRSFRIAATVAACGLAEGFLAHYNTAKLDEDRYMVQLASADVGGDVAKTLQSHIDESKTIQQHMINHFEAIRLSVLNMRVRDKDSLVRWLSIESLSRYVLMAPSMLLTEAKPLGFALYDRNATIRRTAALCLAVVVASKDDNLNFTPFVNFFLTRMTEMPLDTDLWVAALSVLFLSSVELNEETTDAVVDCLWGCHSCLVVANDTNSLSSHKALLKALAIFIDKSTFASSVFDHNNLTDENCFLLLNTVVEFLKEFAIDKWPLYDVFVSAFWERCAFLQRLPSLLEIITVGESDAYMLPVLALSLSVFKHLEVSANAEEPLFTVDADEAEVWLKRSTIALLEKGPILLQMARPHHVPFTILAALLGKALSHLSIVKDLAHASLESLTKALVAAFQACHLGSPCLDNVAAALGLIEDAKVTTNPLTSLCDESIRKVADAVEKGQSEETLALLMRKLLAVLRLSRVNPTGRITLLDLPERILNRYMNTVASAKSRQIFALGFAIYHLSLCYEALNIQQQGKKRRQSEPTPNDFASKLSKWRELVVMAGTKYKDDEALLTVICFSWLGSKRFLHGLLGSDELEENYNFSFNSSPDELKMIICLAQNATSAVEREPPEESYDPLLHIIQKDNSEKTGSTIAVCPYGRFGVVDDLLDGGGEPTQLNYVTGWSVLYYLLLEIETHASLDKTLLLSPLIPLFLSLLTLRCPTYTDAVKSLLNSLCALVDPADTFNAIGRSIFTMLTASQRRTTAKDLAKQIAGSIPTGYLLQNSGVFRKFIIDALRRKCTDKPALRECLSYFTSRLLPGSQSELQTYLLTKFSSDTVDALFRRK